jgi:hypothetical protein
MPSYDPEFQDAAKGPPEYFEPEPRRKGCFFYGCAFSIAGLVIVLLGLAVGAFVLYRTWAHYVEVYTAEEPIPLPRVEAPAERIKDAVERAKAFRDALRSKTKTEPLVLTGDDLNALVREAPRFKDHAYLTIEGDKIRARVSLPLDEFFDNSLTRGRFFNGEAVLSVSVRRGKLELEVESADVGGKPLPGALREFLHEFLEHADVKLDLDEKGGNGLLREVESLDVEDGKVTITSRASAPAAPPEPADPPGPAEAPKPGPAAAP